MDRRFVFFSAFIIILSLNQVYCFAQDRERVSGLVFHDENAKVEDGSPNGFFVFDFNENTYSFKFHPANHNPDFQMRISAPRGDVALDGLENEQIIVNVFAGNPDDLVEYQLDDRPPVRMNHQITTDPLVVEFFSAYKDIDEWVKPKECLHIWTANMPADIEEGSHILKVSTTDSFGRTFKQLRYLRSDNELKQRTA